LLSEGVCGTSDLAIYQAFLPDNDTLMQSAMLKAEDKDDFLQAQVRKLNGLHGSGVFSYHDITMLPHKACLLNAIWSYH
jgi:hypothetical protein